MIPNGFLGHVQGLDLLGRPRDKPGKIIPSTPTTTNYDQPARPPAQASGMGPMVAQQSQDQGQMAQNQLRQQYQQMMLQRMFAGQPQMNPQQQQFAAGPRPQAGYAGAANDMSQWDQYNQQNRATQQGGMQNPLMMLMQLMGGGGGQRMYG